MSRCRWRLLTLICVFSAENAGVFEAVSLRDAIARTVNAIYASESIVYLTTGIADIYKNANIELESAIVKVSMRNNVRVVS